MQRTAMSGRRSNSPRQRALVLCVGTSVLLLYVALAGGRTTESVVPGPAGTFKGTMMHLDAGKAASTFRDEEPASTLRSTQCHAQLSQVHNPMLESAERRRVRDPAVRVLEGGVRELYYTLYEGEPKNMWSDTTGYTVQVVTTTDWHTFSAPKPVTPSGYCSPDAPVEWRGSTLLERHRVISGCAHTLRAGRGCLDSVPRKWLPK